MVNSFTVFDGAGAPSDEATAAGEGERSWGAGMASGVHDAFARGGEVGVGFADRGVHGGGKLGARSAGRGVHGVLWSPETESSPPQSPPSSVARSPSAPI